MAKSRTKLREELRTALVNELMDYFKSKDEDVKLVASNTLAFPCVDAEGNDEWLKVIVQVPTGERGKDGEPYDGYDEADAYALKLAGKAEKAKEAAAKKAAKIAKDKAEREAKAKAKAEHKKGE